MSRGTPITIGGKDRTLRFDMNALAEIEERLGIELRPAEIQKDLHELAAKPMKMATTGRVVLWAGLRHESPELTIEDVGSWVDFENFQEILEGFFGQFPAMSEEAASAISALAGTSEKEEVRVN